MEKKTPFIGLFSQNRPENSGILLIGATSNVSHDACHILPTHIYSMYYRWWWSFQYFGRGCNLGVQHTHAYTCISIHISYVYVCIIYKYIYVLYIYIYIYLYIWCISMQLYMYIKKRIPGLYLIDKYNLSHLQWHFPKLFPRLDVKARGPLLARFSEKRPTSLSFEIWKGLWKNVTAGDIGCSYIQVVPCHPVATKRLLHTRNNNRILTGMHFNFLPVLYRSDETTTSLQNSVLAQPLESGAFFFSFFLSFLVSFLLSLLLSWRKPLGTSMCLHICATTSCTSAPSQTRTHSQAHVLKHRLILL